jgi:hypothetical protein
MTYSLLGHDLHEAADKAKAWFAENYGAKNFKREEPVLDLPLRPTWQAMLNGGYSLCVNVQPSPFSPSLFEFVTQCAQRGLPIKLWVAIGPSPPKESFGADLKQARNFGIGVVQIPDAGKPHEFHRAVPLSLFGLTRTDPKDVPKPRREVLKKAEDTFLDGAPDQACQLICQELEHISRVFAEHTYDKGLWKQPKGARTLRSRFFTKDSWATMLEEMEQRANVATIAAKSPDFSKQLVVRARAFTDWRNAVSHKPTKSAELKKRDTKLRTMFEVTRDLLIDWYHAAKPLGLLK